MQKRIAAMAALGVALGIVLVSSVGAASEDKRTTYLTFSQPVGLPGVTLPAGTYLFEVADPLVSADIIRVSNRKRTMVYFTAWTDRVERRAGERGEMGITFTPAQPESVRRIAAWYPRGESSGHEFIYR
jgi:hypothetical protein